MTRVIIVGAAGRMGRRLVANVMENPEFQLAGATEFVESPFLGEDAGLVAGCGEAGVKITANLDELVKHADAIIDFATGGVMEAVRLAVENNCAAVIGTTALSAAEKGELAELAERGGRIVSAYNMSVGVNLLFKLVGEAARTLGPDYDVEIIEMHHNQKKDAPSGTAVRTAQLIAEARDGRPSEAPGAETEIEGCRGARGALVEGVPVHSVRSMGFVASQETVFGDFGQTLTIRHDSWDRQSYMPGVLLGIRSVSGLSGLIVGLEHLM